MNSFDFAYYLQTGIYLLMGFIGIGFAFAIRNKRPQLSFWAGIYFATKIGLLIFNMVINSVIQNTIKNDAFSSMVSFLTIERYCSTGINIVASLIVLFIIFGWRDEKEPLAIFKI